MKKPIQLVKPVNVTGTTSKNLTYSISAGHLLLKTTSDGVSGDGLQTIYTNYVKESTLGFHQQEGHLYYSPNTLPEGIIFSANLFSGGVRLCQGIVAEGKTTSNVDGQHWSLRAYPGTVITTKVRCQIIVIDLTETFGAGNEPTDEECQEMFTDIYYPYNILTADRDVLVWNQLLQSSFVKYSSATNNITLTTSGHTYSISNIAYAGTGGDPVAITVTNTWQKKDYKYLALVNFTYSGSGITGPIFEGGVPTKAFNHLENDLYYCFFTATRDINNFYLKAGGTKAVGDSWEFSNPMLFDLTTMFGSGNEPTTVAQFKSLFPKDYYEYSLGEVIYPKAPGTGDLLRRRRELITQPCVPIFYDYAVGTSAYVDTGYIVPNNSVIWVSKILGTGGSNRGIVGTSDGTNMTCIRQASASGSTRIAWRYNGGADAAKNIGNYYNPQAYMSLWITPTAGGVFNSKQVTISKGNNFPNASLYIMGVYNSGWSLWSNRIGPVYVYGSDASSIVSDSELQSYTPIASFIPCYYKGQGGFWFVEEDRFCGNSNPNGGSITVVND